MTLVEHARKELELIGASSEKGDFYGGMTGKATLELIELFASQRHSGMSASIVRDLFSKLANFDPLSPLTFSDDEWGSTGAESFQNTRNSAVFKDGKDGRPYYIDAYKMTGEGVGGCWSGSLALEGGRRITKCYIKDASNMPTVTINLCVIRHSDDGGDWDFVPAPMSVISELEKYYDIGTVED